MQITLNNNIIVEIQDWVCLRTKHELQKIYLAGQNLGLAEAKPAAISGEALLKAQDFAVKSLVTKIVFPNQTVTNADEILEKILDLPSQDGEKIYLAVSKILGESASEVPKV